MRRQVITCTMDATDIKIGDRILTNRMTVAEVESTEAFKDSSGRPCIEIGIIQCAQKSAVVFLSGETVLVLE